MRRREVIAGAASALFAPRGAFGQAGAKRRIAYLSSHLADDPLNVMRFGAFEAGLAAFGWQTGKNIEIDYRIIGDANSQIAARELVASGPDVVVCVSTNNLLALTAATKTIPIVFVQVADTLGGATIGSVSRPGGNFTGFVNYELSIFWKQVAVLLEAVPHLKKLTLMHDGTTMTSYFKAALATRSAVPIKEALVSGIETIEQAIVRVASEQDSGLLVGNDIHNVNKRAAIIALAAKHAVPAHLPYPNFVKQGGLISYTLSFSISTVVRRLTSTKY